MLSTQWASFSGKFTAGFNDTGGHIFPRFILIALTPAANFPPVSTTLVVSSDQHYRLVYTLQKKNQSNVVTAS
jgi:hypothetical protein